MTQAFTIFVCANLMGEDGVTERTGDSSRPVDIWLAKGPNLRHTTNLGKNAWADAVSQAHRKIWQERERTTRTGGRSRQLRSR